MSKVCKISDKEGTPPLVKMSNGLVECEVCPEGARLVTFRDAEGEYLYSLPAQLPDGPRAAGVGDIIHNPYWEGGKYEYIAKDPKLGGYSFVKQETAERVGVTVEKKALHDIAQLAWMPGLSVARTFSLSQDSPVLEIRDVRTNLDSCRHAMMYDLMFCLMPGTGGVHRNNMMASPWQQISLAFADGSHRTFGREEVVGREIVFEEVVSVAVWNPVRESGVQLDLDAPLRIGLLTSIGGPWQPFVSVRPRSPKVLARYEVLTRVFRLSPLTQAPPAPRSKTQSQLRKEIRSLRGQIAETSDDTSRACLEGLALVAERSANTGGASHEELAAGFVEELKVQLQAARSRKPLVANFLHEARLREVRELASRLNAPDPPPIHDDVQRPDSNLVESTILAMGKNHAAAIRRNFARFRSKVLRSPAFAECVISPQTISNAGWGESLMLLFCCFENQLRHREKVRILEAIWFLTREIDEFGFGVHGNWGTMERTFLLRAAGFFPHASRREVWIEKAAECLEQTILDKASPDGGWNEPPGYAHHAMLKGLEMLELFEAAGDHQRVERFASGLKKMMEFQWRILQPNGAIPPIGNGWHVFRADIYNRYARRFGMGALMKICLEEGWEPTGKDLLSPGAVPELQPGETTLAERGSDLLPHDGYALFRPDARTQLQIFFGGQIGHGHFDTLSLLLYAHGRPFVGECIGTLKNLGPGPHYASRAVENWMRQSRSHSMILADDHSYAERIPGTCLAWENRPDFVKGVFEATAYPGIVARRSVEMRGFYFILEEHLSGLPENAREFTWRAHFFEDIRLELEGTSVTATAPEGQVRFEFFDLPPGSTLGLDTSPPQDFTDTEPYETRGGLILLRSPRAESWTIRCEITILV